MVQDKFRQDTGEGSELEKQESKERRRRCKRKTAVSSSFSYQGIIGRTTRRESKLASEKRDQENRGTRTRRRNTNNGGSLSSRSSTTGIQCGLCAVLAGLFRRAMCIAGSRRGSGESCYQELSTEMQQQGHDVVNQQHQQIYRTNSNVSAGLPVKIIFPTSRSGSVGSINRLNDSLQQERVTTEITVDSTGLNAVFVRISAEDSNLSASGTSPSASASASYSPAEVESSPDDALPRKLSESDRLLIENLNIGHCRTRNTGRFLTMHKRRRKRLITRSLNQDPALLDDIFHGQVQCVLQRAGNWRFNAFTLETVTGGRSLPVLCVHLFHSYGLFHRFNLDVVRVWKLFALIEEGYHSTNPYHNSIHATDVTQAMHCFLREEKIKRHLNSLEIMASLIAAVTHDLDHPGVNQPFLVATSNYLAILYENTSVLENHHWRSAIGCLLESGVAEQLPARIRPELQRYISSLILATDITRQQEFLTRFKSSLDNDTLDMEHPENRHFILQISLKCADISNPCRPWDISRKWSYKVCEEFFRQGDYERQLNLPVTPLCDRQSISIPRIQTGFFEFVVTPLYKEWHRFLGDGLSVSLMLNLHTNKKRWESLIARETGEEMRTELSDLEQVQNLSTSDDEQQVTPASKQEDIESSDILLPDIAIAEVSERRPSLPIDVGHRRFNRRHSVPLSVTKTMSVLPMIEDSRRESLPSERVKTTRNLLFLLEDAETSIETFNERSSLSLLSSKSSLYESAGNASSSCERPVSAENLLPETSIASITCSAEATRLSSVLQPDSAKPALQTKCLTRQQTFPPLQPYLRIRYMSTTAEMSKCQAETLMEADDDTPSSSKNDLVAEKSSADQGSGYYCCSGNTCSENDCECLRRKKTSSTRLFRQHKTGDNRCSKKRDFADSARLCLDPSSSFISGLPRRHSIQAVQNEDSTLFGLKNRHTRPSSAQEAYPAQTLYTPQISGTKLVTNRNGSDSRTESETQNFESPNRDSLRPRNSLHQLDSSSLNIQNTNQFVALTKLTEKSKHSEPRRYSTPTTDGKITANSNSKINTVIRRFTAIPVASELPTQKFLIASPPSSPLQGQSISSSSESGSDPKPTVADSGSETVSIGIKRDFDSSRQKTFKLRKLSDDGKMKENLDPRMVDDFNTSSIAFSRRTNQGWSRRRGSAPVGLLARLDDSVISTAAVAPRTDRHNTRRGSVPTEVISHQASGSLRAALGPRGENVPLPRRASLPQEAALSNLLENVLFPADVRGSFPANNNNNNNNNGAHMSSNNNGSSRGNENIGVSGMMLSPRRGSVPSDVSELHRDSFGRNSVNGKTRNRKKKLIRRSSGGPEMFSGRVVGDDNENGKSGGWKREMSKRDSIPEPSVKRRGSLPVETVSIFHPGRYNYR